MTRCRPLVLLIVALLGAAAPSVAAAQERRVLTTAHASSTTACPDTACLEIGGQPNGVSVEVNDRASGTFELVYEMTLTGVAWLPVDMTPINGGAAVEGATAGGMWRGAAGMRFRVRQSSLTSGPPEVIIKRLDFPPTAAGTSGGGGGGDFDIATFQTTFGTTGLFRTASQADDVAVTPDSLYTTSFGMMYDGTTFDMVRGTAADGLLVNLGTNNDVTVTSGTITTLTTLTGGGVAHDAADSGNPLKIGGFASATAPAAVTGNDRVNAWFNLRGAQAVMLTSSDGSIPDLDSNDLSRFRSIDLDETEEEISDVAATLYGIWFSNLATATRFLKCYNADADDVTVGTTTPVITLALPGNSSDDITGSLSVGGMGIPFDTAITCAATTGVADNDTGAPGANEVLVNVFFK